MTAFTICSFNYLAQAKALQDSFLEHNPEDIFYIVLVDVIPKDLNIDISQFNIILIEDVGVEGFKEMCTRYNLVELNTAVKPGIFQYFFDKGHEKVMYIDPDIMIYAPFKTVSTLLGSNSVVLTPHILTPINDKNNAPEVAFLLTGVYNLGFLGLCQSHETRHLLSWWHERLKTQGYACTRKGVFFDQKWMNFAPVFCPNTFILRDYGHNMAPWNFHERRLSVKNAQYYVNNEFPLVFFHFSSVKILIEDKNIISKHTKYNLKNRSDLKTIIDDYRDTVRQNNYKQFMTYKCHFAPPRKKIKKGSVRYYSALALNKALDFIDYSPRTKEVIGR